jgi:hypothetical protein
MQRSVNRRAAGRALASIAGLSLALTALIGFAHTTRGRPLLAWLGGGHAKSGGCPFGYDVARTPEQKEAARRGFAAVHAGEGRAAARPALGFALDRTTRADVAAWASTHGVSCKAPRSGPDLDCAGVPDAALPEPYRGAPIVSLWLTFDGGDRLVAAVAVREAPGAAPVSATFGAVVAEVDRLAGAHATREGDASPAALASGLLREASAEQRFHDYYAVIRAANLGNRFALTEEYRSLPEG